MTASPLPDEKRIVERLLGADRKVKALERLAGLTPAAVRTIKALREANIDAANLILAMAEELQQRRARHRERAEGWDRCHHRRTEPGKCRAHRRRGLFDTEHDDGTWWWANTDSGDYHGGSVIEVNFHQPTHWMPLPITPTTGGPNGQ